MEALPEILCTFVFCYFSKHLYPGIITACRNTTSRYACCLIGLNVAGDSHKLNYI